MSLFKAKNLNQDAMGRDLRQPVIEVNHRDAVAPSDEGWVSVDVHSKLSLTELRQKVEGKSGRRLWQTLDELAESPRFLELMRKEFPRHHQAATEVDRRDFMKLMGAGMALAGLTACTKQPLEKIVPYVRPPEETVPGKPLFYASALPLNGFGFGVLVESHLGRPTKLEGNELHPASLGGTDHRVQASVLDLYDPDRSQSVLQTGRMSSWPLFEANLNLWLEAQKDKKGAGIRLLTGSTTSPTLNDQIQRLKAMYPAMKWHQYEPMHRDEIKAGSRLAFGEVVDPVYDFSKADIVLSLGADVFTEGPGRIRYARDFADHRKVRDEHPKLNRMYVVETASTITGVKAEHRLPLSPAKIVQFTHAVSAAVAGTPVPAKDGLDAEFLKALIADLKSHQGSSLVVAGQDQPAEVHALAHLINEALGNVGQTVRYVEALEYGVENQQASLAELVKDMADGQVDVLVLAEVNPVYDAPQDLKLTESMKKVEHTVQLCSLYNETSFHCEWHLPAAHPLTHWGDVKAYDGSVSFLQPTIEPLYSGKSIYELLALMLGEGFRGSDEIVKEYWKTQLGDGFEKVWRKALHDGIVAGQTAAEKSVHASYVPKAWSSPEAGLEIQILPDPCITDGQSANNGWLQELPKALTTVTWDNVILVPPALAEEEGIQNEDMLEVDVAGTKVVGPAWISPGHDAQSLTLYLGYGRERGGRIGTGLGYNAYKLLRHDQGRQFQQGALRKTGRRYPVAATQAHHPIADRTAAKRNLIRVGTVDRFKEHPGFATDHHFVPLEHPATKETSLYPGYDYSKGNQWGMVIDLNACIGCNACITACQAENNIPVVGKEQVGRGREMQWIRLDRYYEGDPANPTVHHQPIACVHCENAPCETVCPVGATSHSSDGLNQMVYNRCVGTRYCSNNCPYKVRRFNFFQFTDETTESLKLQRNPDVTVRVRGVMEKCTYCVQRISWGRITAKVDGERAILDGEVQTACQQACPTRAIAFGNINDPESEVAKLKNSPLNYTILSDINTMPRTTHLAKVINPSPMLAAKEPEHGVEHEAPMTDVQHGGGHV